MAWLATTFTVSKVQACLLPGASSYWYHPVVVKDRRALRLKERPTPGGYGYRRLTILAANRGLPQSITVDNGAEFCSRAIDV